MEKLSDRLNKMSISATLEMAQKSRNLQSQGVDIINLSLGEPDFNTPQNIKDAAKKAIDENYTRYSPVAGYESLRKIIVEKFKRENNLDFNTDQIVVSTGAKQSIINVLLSIINPGDEVIVPAPYWVSYIEMIKLAEGIPVVVKCGYEANFKINKQQLKDAITNKTKAIIFSSPSNPTGNLYSKEELKDMAEVIAQHPNIIVLSDEIYEHINFVGKHQSIAQFPEIKDRVVVINGVSKAYAMTGWRIGYIGAPLWIAKAATKLQGQFTSGTCSISQKAAEAALSAGYEASVEMTAKFKTRRDLVLDLLKEIPGIKTNNPQGAFYVFMEVSSYFGKSYDKKTINDSDDLSLYLLEKAHVATVGGNSFGSKDCIRISYATSDELLIKAINKIKDALENLK